MLSLEQAGPQGELYHLNNAVFDVIASGGFGLQTFDASGADRELDVKVPPGLADVILHDGWTLEKSTDGGATFQPVDALLATSNPSTLRVLAGEPVFVQYDFIIRQVDGTLKITLGVVTQPSELVGGFIVTSGTDGLAGYGEAGNAALDFAVYFQPGPVKSEILGDGTKQVTYFAGDFGVPSPLSPESTAVAAEFFNDNLGILTTQIAPQLAGATLEYTVAATPAGIQLSGLLSGFNESGFTEIDFGPNLIDVDAPTLDADGFPNDEFFYDATLPFTQTSTIGTLTGTLRMRFVPPQP